MDEDVGMGESGETYLVGSDNMMRPNSYSSEESDILNTKIDSVPVKNALNGETGSEIIEDNQGIRELSSYQPLNIAGINWAVLAEIDEDEAFAAANSLQTTVL